MKKCDYFREKFLSRLFSITHNSNRNIVYMYIINKTALSDGIQQNLPQKNETLYTWYNQNAWTILYKKLQKTNFLIYMYLKVILQKAKGAFPYNIISNA